jgi:aspartyl aminopeptidase
MEENNIKIEKTLKYIKEYNEIAKDIKEYHDVCENELNKMDKQGKELFVLDGLFLDIKRLDNRINLIQTMLEDIINILKINT